MISQIPLGINLRDEATFESFYPGDNDNIIEIVSNFIVNQELDKRILVLTGVKDSGKTHILQSSCIKAEELSLTSIYLPLKQIKNISSQYLEGIENLNFICIDNVEVIMGVDKCEAALLKFLTNVEYKNGKVLIAVAETDNELKFNNQKLVEKLSISYNQPIEPLNDEQKLEAINLRANLRGIGIDERVAKFLIRNCQTNLSGLFSHLDKLDKESLANQRKLTIPFVKDVLNL